MHIMGILLQNTFLLYWHLDLVIQYEYLVYLLSFKIEGPGWLNQLGS